MPSNPKVGLINHPKRACQAFFLYLKRKALAAPTGIYFIAPTLWGGGAGVHT